MPKRLFVTGNGTGVGKTVVSALLCQALQADYWKPVQAGELDSSDTMSVAKLVSHADFKSYPEAFRLKAPLSPHAAAAMQGLQLETACINSPDCEKTLVIEGAGGVYAPLSHDELMVDLIQKLQAQVVFVSKHYLGSINHTLLSLEALQRRKIDIVGIIFNAADNASSREVILARSGLKSLLEIGELPILDKNVIAELALRLKGAL